MQRNDVPEALDLSDLSDLSDETCLAKRASRSTLHIRPVWHRLAITARAHALAKAEALASHSEVV